MSENIFSPDWYRFANLRPRLRAHVKLHRQIIRGEPWHVVQDDQTGKYHRLNEKSYSFVGHMDGRQTVQSLWERLCAQFPDNPPTQTDIVRIISQLYSTDLVSGSRNPNFVEMSKRKARQDRTAVIARIKNPLALRFPLVDPNEFLERTKGLVRPLFTVYGLALWLITVTVAVVLFLLNVGEVTGSLSDRYITQQNIAIVLLSYPVIKGLHELGHAYATKVWGGDVHEIGIMMLVFIPVPYVDASASGAFSARYKRLVVTGAGIIVELFLASVAMILWVFLDEGTLRAIAFNVMLVGGVSTLLFNGNPLLRFDGYFILVDLLEMPNLGKRSNQYLGYVYNRYWLGIRNYKNPVTAPKEEKWLFSYSILAFLYRIFISITIAMFVASKAFVIGVALAALTISNVLVMPALKGVQYLFTDPKTEVHRVRSIVLTIIPIAVLVAVLLVPLPRSLTVQGEVLPKERYSIRAGVAGFVDAFTASDSTVQSGETVLTLQDPVIDKRIQLLRTQLAEVDLGLKALPISAQQQLDRLLDQRALVDRKLSNAQEQRDRLNVEALAKGRLVVLDERELEGRFIEKGHLVGYVLHPDGFRIRVAVVQRIADELRGVEDEIEVIFQTDPGTRFAGRFVSETPESSDTLPSKALSREAGGPFTLIPGPDGSIRTLESLFYFDVEVSAFDRLPAMGERVYVKVPATDKSLMARIYATTRQVFLKYFSF